MASLTKAEASRRNGSRSQGPVTPEGKTISCRNAVTHGMYSRVAVLANESPELFAQLLDRYMTEFLPQTTREIDLVHDIVNARWRLNRIITLETAALDYEMDRQKSKETQNDPAALSSSVPVSPDEATRACLAFNQLVDGSRSLAMLNRSESRLLHTIQRASAELDRLRSRRDALCKKCENEPENGPDGNADLSVAADC